MDNRKIIVEQAIANKVVDRVPVGFWYHYTDFSEHCRGLVQPEIIDRVIKGHKKMYDELKPDFFKIMSDGFFGHPSMMNKKFEKAEDLKQIKSVGSDHPWIRKQVEMVNELLDYTHHEVISFYSVFSPLSAIRLHFFEDEGEPDKFVKLFMENPQIMVEASKEIEKDMLYLINALASETEIDGIYYSVQEVQGGKSDEAFHKKYVEVSDIAVLDEIEKKELLILLHICGWGEFTNNLDLYKNYPSDIVNWATHTENISLKEGKEIFKDKAVIGGFDNNPGTLLYTGSNDEIKKYVEKLLDECGCQGVMIGSDCTVNSSISFERLKYVREIAEEYAKLKNNK